MKKVFALIAIIIALGVYTILGSTAGFAVGKARLLAHDVEYDGQSVTLTGNASMSMSAPNAPLKLGQMRLESVTAQKITVGITKDKTRKLAMGSASATGGVVVRAKRADSDTDPNGKPVKVMRDVYASAQSAVMPQTQDVVKLTGNVVVKITEPGMAEPVATVAGDVVTVSLKDGKIRITGQGDKQAEVMMTLGEGEKK